MLVACPDARPPAYQAVIGLARAGMLQQFVTSFYHRGDNRWLRLGRQIAPGRVEPIERRLQRRRHVEIPALRVRSQPSVDLALAVENRLGSRRASARQRVARWRTRHVDRTLAKTLREARPDAALIFSDVGSEFALPTCRARGIAAVLSMVHGDVREERQIIACEAERSPDFFPLYLADGPIDHQELAWLHERRLRDIALADMILVPSEHIASELTRHGTPRDRIRVIPYAADTRRFQPEPEKRHESTCTFLFTGGITQRKGIKYLLDAWRRIRRPGWRLQLLGGMPSETGPLEPYRDEVEWLGRVGHAEVPARMAAADVFVFPSLFEGSAVVTYEALACGLPSIVTPSAGSVVRDGIEGRIVPPADIDALAESMETLGNDPELRAEMSRRARERALAFDWPRYHHDVNAALCDAVRSGR